MYNENSVKALNKIRIEQELKMQEFGKEKDKAYYNLQAYQNLGPEYEKLVSEYRNLQQENSLLDKELSELDLVQK